MSLYYVQKLLYNLNRDPRVVKQFETNRDALFDEYDLSPDERTALRDGDIGLLYVTGVNGQLLMHFAALLGYEWSAYLDAMRAGVARHGPVRAGIYAMKGD